jgi:hypothetical protein
MLVVGAFVLRLDCFFLSGNFALVLLGHLGFVVTYMVADHFPSSLVKQRGST